MPAVEACEAYHEGFLALPVVALDLDIGEITDIAA